MEQINEAAVQKKTGGARVQQTGGNGGRGKLALGIAAAAVIAIAGGYAALCAYAQHTQAIWKGTQVLGQEVGGLSVESAAAQVEQALGGLGVDLYLYDGAAGEELPARAEQPDATVPLKDLPVDIDVPSLVADADRAVRSGSFLTAGWRYLTHTSTQYGGSPEDFRSDSAALSALSEGLADTLSIPVQNTEYKLEDSTLHVTLAKDGRAVEAGELQERLEKGGWCFDLSMDVPYHVVPGETTTAQAIHDEVYGEVKNAGYDAATDSIIPEQVGADFDVAAAQAAMDGGEPGQTVSIPAQIQQPAVTAEALKGVLFRDVLGEARTHVGGTAARRTNVKLASSAFNGVVMNTGDVFSYNGTVGQRTAARGYKAAPAYVQGETVDEIGGGVCQPSSTLYLACLRANMAITERHAHRYTPSYIEWGMDATVSWGGPDYKFTNNRDYPIKIVTIYQDNYLTVRILGTNVDGSYVKMTHEQVSSTPFQVVYEDDPSLPAGTERVKTTPYTGARVKSYRHVYAADGTLLSSNFEDTSDYKSRNRVIVRGPAAPVEEPSTEVPAQGGGTIVVPQEPVTDPTPPVVPQEPAVTDPVPEPPVVDPQTPIVVVPELEPGI